MRPIVTPWQSLKIRVTVFTLAVFVLGIWSLSYYLSRTLQADMERLLGEQQFSAVTAVAKEVNENLSDRLQALETVAKEMDADLMASPTALHARLKQRPLLQLLFNGGVWVAGPDGTAIADVPLSANRIGINYMDRDYMVAALKEGQPAISRPVMGKQLKAPVFAMTAPVRDAQGKVIGVLVGATNLGQRSFLDKITQRSQVESATYILLVEKFSRLIVTASDSRLVMKNLSEPGAKPLLDRFIQGYEGSGIVINALGQEVLASAKGIPVTSWYVAMGLPLAEAFAPIDAMQQRMLMATLLLTLLTGVLTWLVLRRELAPVVEAASAMVALADKQQTPQPLALNHQGEIGQLVAGFNRILQTWTLREAALQKSEQNLAITLNSIGDAVIATDIAGRITGMNPTAERLTAWPLADALGQPLSEVFRIISAETRLPSVNPAQRVMERGEVVGLLNHTALLARDGREYQIADSAAPIRNAADQIMGVVLVFSDVTEKYQIELALKESEQQYRSLLANLSAGVVVHRADTTIMLSNAMAAKLIGLTQEQMEGKAAADPDWCFIREDGTPMPLDEYPVNRVLASGEPLANYVVGTRHKRNAAPVWVICNAYPTRDDNGNISQTVVTFTDITERKLAQSQLQLAASVFTHAREGITITDAGGNILDVNEAFTRITGYSRAEVIGQNPRMLQSGRQDRSFYVAMWEALTGCGHWSGEVWNRRKDGEVYAELLTISSVKDAAGTVLHYVALFSDITALKEHQSQLEHIAHFDALTNLPNRLLLADRLQQALVQALRRGQQLAVAYLDLDGFKAINDNHGHEVGDRVLIALASRMKDCLREGDTLARLGGDEFVAVLIDLNDTSDSAPLLDRLLAAVALAVQVGELSLQVSASMGVTFYPQAHDIQADQLLRQADQAMYQAKLAGKNRYHVFDSAQDSSIRVQHESLERIRLALAHGEFVLHYQPKVNMHNGTVIGAEALIRWQHPEKGLLAPAAFLQVIEDHPLAVDVGEWVIEAALHQMETWNAAGLDLPVSVNIGSRQLQQADFVARLQTILARHPHVRPASLELEVLETSALADMAQVSQVIEDCHAIGMKFALDDFGTGYSSLTYLKQLRVALLKIDQSFVRDMLDDPDDLAILQGIIGLAAAFKREVIAEGVETVAHGSALLQLGCELAQGYGIARPMPAEQMLAWAAAWQPDAAWFDVRSTTVLGVVALLHATTPTER